MLLHRDYWVKSSGVATGWTGITDLKKRLPGMDMSTPVFPESLWGKGGGVGLYRSISIFTLAKSHCYEKCCLRKLLVQTSGGGGGGIKPDFGQGLPFD